MWFLLLINASYNNKNFISEFSDLYEILYKDDEILANPDLNSQTSVVALAPLSIWIHLNIKMLASQNQEGVAASALSPAAKSKSLITPEIIKSHASLKSVHLILLMTIILIFWLKVVIIRSNSFPFCQFIRI